MWYLVEVRLLFGIFRTLDMTFEFWLLVIGGALIAILRGNSK